MAQIPTEQQIVPEDFPPKDQDVIRAVADPFNTYVLEANEALRRNLTFNDNFRGEVKKLNITGGQPITFLYALPEFKPIGLWLASFRNLTDSSEVVSSGVSVQWSQDGKGNITIQTITGLTASNVYECVFVIISE